MMILKKYLKEDGKILIATDNKMGIQYFCRVDERGENITNFINKSQYNENLVKTTLLSKLNEIMGEDANFTEIITQQVKQGEINKWEIFLREEEK